MFRPDPDFRDQQQRPDRLAKLPETIAQLRLEVLYLFGILRHGQPAVKVDAQPGLAEVGGRQASLYLLDLSFGPLGLP